MAGLAGVGWGGRGELGVSTSEANVGICHRYSVNTSSRCSSHLQEETRNPQVRCGAVGVVALYGFSQT